MSDKVKISYSCPYGHRKRDIEHTKVSLLIPFILLFCIGQTFSIINASLRLRNAEDELNELRSHVHLLKDTATSKEEQSTLLLGDVS